jgi:hypothetical protein
MSKNLLLDFLSNNIPNLLNKKIHHIITYKEYNNPKSFLNKLNFLFYNDLFTINTNDINDNLRHTDPLFDRILHQSKIILFEKNTCLPICYINKPITNINMNDSLSIKNENSFLKSYVYDIISDFHENEFDHSIVSIYKHHIGSYIVLFYHNDKWHFLYKGVHELNPSTHYILYEHICHHLSKLDTNLCYHIILKDIRLQKLFTCNSNHIVLLKITEKYTLNEIVDIPANINTLFIIDKRIYLSCIDELNVRLEEIDMYNVHSKKMLNRGFLLKIKNNHEDILIAYDTYLYSKLINMVPQGLSLHAVYLKLYQSDLLNFFLLYTNNSYTDIIKRINMSISTMSREILDIYHMTRNKNNKKFYSLLPHSYKQILYQLHSKYIDQKNDNACSYSDDDSFSTYDKSSAINSAINSAKLSISVDNVYTKLKQIDISLLIDLFKDRDELLIIRNQNNKYPIKDCTYTLIQSSLLKINRSI